MTAVRRRIPADIRRVPAAITRVCDVKAYGAYGDGKHDDTAFIAEAISDAIAGHGIVFFPPGSSYRVTSGFTLTSAVLIRGDGGAAGGVMDSANNFATILHDFDGDLFTFNGADGGAQTSGGGVEGLRIVQSYSGASPATRGVAIVITGADVNHRASWCKCRNLVIEEAGGDPWKYAIEVDGTACGGVPDLYIGEVSTHTSNAATGAVWLKQADGPLFYNCTFYIEGHVTVSGTSGHITSSAQFVNCSGGTFAINWAGDTTLIGGVWSTITDTTNVTGNTTLIPGRLVNAFASNNSASVTSPVGAFWFEPNAATETIPSRFRLLRPLLLENNQNVYGRNAAGSNMVPTIGVDGNNSVVINAAGSARICFGTIGNFGSGAGASALKDLMVEHGVSLRAQNAAGNNTISLIESRTGDDKVHIGRGAGGILLSGLGAGLVHADANGNASSSALVNADVSASAAIAGTKVSPDFGSQNVVTTGTLGAGATTVGALVASSLRATALGAGIGHLDANGNLTSSNIVNADIDANAAIADTKLATLPQPRWNVRSLNTTANAAANDFCLCSTSGGGWTLTLAAASSSTNKMIGVKKVSADANSLTVATSGGNIDGAATRTIQVQYTAETYVSDGTNWYVI